MQSVGMQREIQTLTPEPKRVASPKPCNARRLRKEHEKELFQDKLARAPYVRYRVVEEPGRYLRRPRPIPAGVDPVHHVRDTAYLVPGVRLVQPVILLSKKRAIVTKSGVFGHGWAEIRSTTYALPICILTSGIDINYPPQVSKQWRTTPKI